ncbi:hypothetical protein Tco_1154315 [Tanacetum coccineum]
MVESKAKFRRRVSAYVADWIRSVNSKLNDRAPVLGYSAVKPDGWEKRFCEVHDNNRDMKRSLFVEVVVVGDGGGVSWRPRHRRRRHDETELGIVDDDDDDIVVVLGASRVA